ncbi:metal-dependent hydrolase [Methanoregula sp.]|uniref:metal-dependent hydrolase n=1 Tax=Methanoregula sp. TaxID=2052170 RepID=UPI002372CB48|nr:metal-dependent hydrolase [Methanoregula sp.]MDD1687884.1 metal-dependent hydrolase [Methanoregula sp.]
MITRHHIALTILCTLILCSALVPDAPFVILMICTGAGIGAILPDIQMKKPQHFKIRTFAWMVTLFGSALCTPLLCRLYRCMTGVTFDSTDKRLTHSLFGIVFLWAVLAAILLVPVSLLSDHAALDIVALFLEGVMLGLVLHLIEDLCTRKGITPIFPISTVKIFGSIRPCDTTDRRIAQFHYYDCSVAGIFLAFQFLGTGQAFSAIPVCLLGLFACLGMMILSSDVEIIPEDLKDTLSAPPVVMLDPVSFLGTPRYPTTGLMMGVYYYQADYEMTVV